VLCITSRSGVSDSNSTCSPVRGFSTLDAFTTLATPRHGADPTPRRPDRARASRSWRRGCYHPRPSLDTPAALASQECSHRFALEERIEALRSEDAFEPNGLNGLLPRDHGDLLVLLWLLSFGPASICAAAPEVSTIYTPARGKLA